MARVRAIRREAAEQEERQEELADDDEQIEALEVKLCRSAATAVASRPVAPASPLLNLCNDILRRAHVALILRPVYLLELLRHVDLRPRLGGLKIFEVLVRGAACDRYFCLLNIL